MSKEHAEKTMTDEKKKRSSHKKRPTKQQLEIKKLKEEKEQLHDQLLRKIAEFDNYKKRTEREFFERVQNATEKLIVNLLPVLDDMERSIEHAQQHGNEVESLIQGSELIYKKLLAILEKEGLESLPSVGEDFNPEKHDALMQADSKEYESGKIINEHQRGYLLNGKVIRHSQVIVAK